MIHIRAFTKVFAVPGLRIGYLICGEDRLLRKIRLHLPEWNLSTAAEDAGTAAAKVLAETDFLARSLCMIRKEREYLTEEFRALGLRVCPGDANYLLVQADPELPDRLLERGILVRKCGNFHGLTDSWMRIAVRDHDENKVLTDILKEIIL